MRASVPALGRSGALEAALRALVRGRPRGLRLDLFTRRVAFSLTGKCPLFMLPHMGAASKPALTGRRSFNSGRP